MSFRQNATGFWQADLENLPLCTFRVHRFSTAHGSRLRLTGPAPSRIRAVTADTPLAHARGSQALLFEFTQADALRKHGRAVEEAMRACARRAGVTDPAEIERWGIVGMLHDFDYEQNPTEDTHLHVGGRILRERGYAEEMVGRSSPTRTT